MSASRQRPRYRGFAAWASLAVAIAGFLQGDWVVGGPPRIGIDLPLTGGPTGAVEVLVFFPESEAQPVDLFYLAIAAGYTFDPLNQPWQFAVTNLDPQASNVVHWIDATAFQDAYRVYAAGYTGQDDDFDGLPDAREVLLYATDPGLADTDEDGLGDGWEHANGLDPLDDGSTDPNQGGDGNPDGDDLLNIDEQALGTSPHVGNLVARLDAAEITVETVSVGGWMDTNTMPASPVFPCGDLDAVGWGTGIVYSIGSGLCTTGATSGMARRVLAGDGVNTELDRLGYRLGASTVSGVIHSVSWVEVHVAESDPASPGRTERSYTAFFVGDGGLQYVGLPRPFDPPGQVYPALAGPAAVADFVIEPPGSNGWVQIVLPQLGMTAYRPLIEGPGYGAPVQRAAVPDAAEEIPGAGIRVNGDTESASAENDLIEIELELPAFPPPAGLQFALRRSAPQLRVWASSTGEGPVITTNDQAAITFTSQTFSVWAEHTGGGAADLSLIVEDATAPGRVLAEDHVRLYPFTSLVLALGGEDQGPTDPGDANHGVFRLALDLIQQGYDVHLYDDDLVASDGSGPVYQEVLTAVADRGVTEVAMFGYSHGAGSIYHLTERMQAHAVTNLEVVYTAYIDAVRNNSDIDTAQERRRPVDSLYHVNYYQEGSFFQDLGLDGGPTIDPPGADFEDNRDDPVATETHYTVDDEPEVLAGIESRFLQEVTP